MFQVKEKIRKRAECPVLPGIVINDGYQVPGKERSFHKMELMKRLPIINMGRVVEGRQVEDEQPGKYNREI